MGNQSSVSSEALPQQFLEDHADGDGDLTEEQTRGASTESKSSSTSSILPIPQGALLRTQHRGRNPHDVYETLKVLGDGSMGSVSHVRKRTIGGSARADFVKEQQKEHCCWGVGVRCFSLSFCPPSKNSQKRSPPSSRSSSMGSLFTSLDTIDEQSNRLLSTVSTRTSSTRTVPTRNGCSLLLSSSSSSRSSSQSAMISYDGDDRRSNKKKEGLMTFALKSIHLNQCSDSVLRQELVNEVAILQRLDHPNIVKAMETYDYQHNLYLVLELCSGGDLYSRDPYDEQQACQIARSIVDAVAYMHSRAITHRDLKYENVMFANPTSYAVKIIDFGLSKKYKKETVLSETVGTVYTMAPEVLQGEYDNKCDMWSIGVLMFMLLSSSLPFYGKSRQQVVQRILNHQYGFKGPRWLSISEEAKELIMNLLLMSPKRRPTAEEALKSPWLQRVVDSDIVEAPLSHSLMDKVQASIQAFSKYSKLKKLALLVVAYKSTNEEVGYLRQIFRKFDQRFDGEISLSEFKKALLEYNYSGQELEDMFAAMDLDATGKVHYSEFLAATIETHGSIEEERIAEAFDRIDSDDSGYITVTNIVSLLGPEISREFASSVIQEVDLNSDGRIEYSEFISLWNECSDLQREQALKEVNLRRETFDDGPISNVNASDPVGALISPTSPDSTSNERGKFFFDQEKEKSIRGAWV